VVAADVIRVTSIASKMEASFGRLFFPDRRQSGKLPVSGRPQ
jgi:hypothetical protein